MKSIFILLLCGIFLLTANCKKEQEKEIWYCPMHPTYISDHAGQCPICNMNLVKKETKVESEHKHDQVSEPIKKETEKKENSISISEEKQTLIGIKTEKAQMRILQKKIISYSKVAYDPELYTAILEYREAKKNIDVENESVSDNTVLNASIVRLKQLGLTNYQITEWGNSNKNPDELILGSKNGRAYIYSSIYEPDIKYIKPGQKIVFKTNSYADKTFNGRILSIDSILDEKNRTLRIRSSVSDPESYLKPQMFGNIEINVSLKKSLTVPKSAILNTGKHKLAYIKKGENQFSQVQVKTGNESDDYIEILEGIEEEDEVVTESNFLLDSESRIKLGDKVNETSN